MANINIDIKEVQRQSKLLKEASAQLVNSAVKPVRKANERVSAVWTGNSAKAFTDYAEEVASLLQSNAQDISEISTFLNKAAVTMKNADQAAKHKI